MDENEIAGGRLRCCGLPSTLIVMHMCGTLLRCTTTSHTPATLSHVMRGLDQLLGGLIHLAHHKRLIQVTMPALGRVVAGSTGAWHKLHVKKE